VPTPQPAQPPRPDSVVPPVPTPVPAAPVVPPTTTPTAAPAIPAVVPQTPAAQPAPPAGAIGQPVTAQPVPPGQALPGQPAPPSTIPAGATSGAVTAAAAEQAMPGAMVTVARLRLNDTATAMNGYDIEIHKKFALAVACIVFVLLGAPVALRFPRGGVGLVIGISLFVFALYYCFLIAGEELATRGYLPPWLSMWAANVLFGAVGVVLAARMGRESGSARGGGIGEWVWAWRHRRAMRRAARAAAGAPRAQRIA
jgi:lipopolysaccharide export system permease protein